MLRPVLRDAVLLSLPLAVSVLLVNALFYPDGVTVLVELGPFEVTAEGLRFSAEVLARVFAVAAALVLFSRTTRPSELVASLEAHRTPVRLTFVIAQSVVLVPRTLDRARMVAAAQRARGLVTEGSPWRRVRGVLALAGPTVLGSIDDAEGRTLALESRGFSRPGPRTLLWMPSDSRWQRLARWLLVAISVLLVAATVTGTRLP